MEHKVGYLWEADETNTIVQRCGLLPGIHLGKIYHCYIAFLTALSCKLISELLYSGGEMSTSM
jgi:hypothetical protein